MQQPKNAVGWSRQTGDDIAVKLKLIEDGNEKESDSTIAALYKKLVFHGGGHTADDDLYEEDIYVGLGNEYREFVEKNCNTT